MTNVSEQIEALNKILTREDGSPVLGLAAYSHLYGWYPHIPSVEEGWCDVARCRWQVGIRKQLMVAPNKDGGGMVYVPELDIRLNASGSVTSMFVAQFIADVPVLATMYDNLTQTDSEVMFFPDWLRVVYGDNSWKDEIGSGKLLEKPHQQWIAFLKAVREVYLHGY